MNNYIGYEKPPHTHRFEEVEEWSSKHNYDVVLYTAISLNRAH